MLHFVASLAYVELGFDQRALLSEEEERCDAPMQLKLSIWGDVSRAAPSI